MPATNYATMNGVLLGETGPKGTQYYHTDALGSVTMTSDQSGAVLNTYRYKPYGAIFDVWLIPGWDCSHGSLAQTGDLMVVSTIPENGRTGCTPPQQPSWLSFKDFKSGKVGHASMSLQWGDCLDDCDSKCSCEDTTCDYGPCFSPKLTCLP